MGWDLTRDRSIDFKQIGFFLENLCSFLDNVETVLLTEPPFTIKVVFEKGNVWFGRIYR
jgi:hypothetical protein